MILIPGCSSCCCESISSPDNTTSIEIDIEHDGPRYYYATLVEYLHQSNTTNELFGCPYASNGQRVEWTRRSLAAFLPDLTGTYSLTASAPYFSYTSPDGSITLDAAQWTTTLPDGRSPITLRIRVAMWPRAARDQQPPTHQFLQGLNLPGNDYRYVYNPQFFGSVDRVCDLNNPSTRYEFVSSVGNQQDFGVFGPIYHDYHPWEHKLGGVSLSFDEGCRLPVSILARVRYESINRALYSQSKTNAQDWCPTPTNGFQYASGPHDVELQSTFEFSQLTHNYRGSSPQKYRDEAATEFAFDTTLTITGIRLVSASGEKEIFGDIGQVACANASTIPAT